MEHPPTYINDALVLEFVIFNDEVERTSVVLIDAGPGDPKPVRALAICQSFDKERLNVLYLFMCTDDWCVDRLQMWNWPGGGSKADTTEVIKTHASTLYSGLSGKWVHVAAIQAEQFVQNERGSDADLPRKWWQIWR